MDSGNKKQINVGHSQIYLLGFFLEKISEGRREKEEEGMEKGGEQLGEEGENEKVGVFIQKSPSCRTTKGLLTNHTGQAFIYKRTRFLPTFPVPFGFGLARKATRIAWHVEFWLSPANSEAQESHSRALHLLQTSSEAELGGRDGGDRPRPESRPVTCI